MTQYFFYLSGSESNYFCLNTPVAKKLLVSTLQIIRSHIIYIYIQVYIYIYIYTHPVYIQGVYIYIYTAVLAVRSLAVASQPRQS